jgi:hypothetical protein
VVTADVLQEVGPKEPPGSADLLARKRAVTGECENRFGADPQQVSGLFGGQDLHIFRHLLLSPGFVSLRDCSGGTCTVTWMV